MTETLLDISTISLKMNNNDRKEIYEVYRVALEKLESQQNQKITLETVQNDVYYLRSELDENIIKEYLCSQRGKNFYLRHYIHPEMGH